jgi:hypothetical protein
MKITRKAISDLTDILLEGGAVKATKYFSDKLIVRAVRRTYGRKIVKRNIEIVLTIGKPNYQERAFIKQCKKSGEPFPVKNIQIKWSNV